MTEATFGTFRGVRFYLETAAANLNAALVHRARVNLRGTAFKMFGRYVPDLLVESNHIVN